MEQILIRNLPLGTKARLKALAALHDSNVESEARAILTRHLDLDAVTLVDLLSTDEGADIDFDPRRLGLTARTPDL